VKSLSLPVRLVFGDNNFTIPVQAEEITMGVHRKMHAFPIPGGSERVGIDANQPTMQMNLSLILEDDRAQNAFAGSGMKNLIQFAWAGTTVANVNKHGTRYGPTYDEKSLSTAGFYSAGATSISLFIPNTSRSLQIASYLAAAPKIYDVYGEVGTKAVSTNLVLTLHSSGAWKTTIALTGGGLSRGLGTRNYVSYDAPYTGKELHIPLAKFFNESKIKLVMDSSTVSNRAGGAGTPSVASGNLVELGDVTINVPIGGVTTAPANGNPASTFALIIKDALELTTNITNISTGVDGNGGKRVVDAFTVTVRSSNSAVLMIAQTYINSDEEVSFTMGRKGNPNLLTPIYEIKSGVPPHGMMSAGDKAQTLLGLFANANVSDEHLLRGIQIPYDSLIQSDAVTPEVRNFFTTFGNNAGLAIKGSVANVFPASNSMKSNQRDSMDGQSIVDNADEDKGFIDTLFDYAEDGLDFAFTEILNLGTLYDGFEQIATEIGNAFRDGGEVNPENHAGGIYILPENFHLRKEAGKNHYVADLELVMVHRVAGI
jgi:hypothetical protein